jgi:hypothetical protein
VFRPVLLLCLAFLGNALADDQTLSLPPRPTGALGGAAFASRVGSLDLAARENGVYSQITSGNVPDFIRHLCPVTVTNLSGGRTNTATFFVTPDYLAIGSDADYFLVPISPNTAQRIADGLHCSLPTPKMVNAIYSAAAVKLTPSPMPPGPAMTTVEAFTSHNATVSAQRAEQLQSHPLGALVAGHKKDVVITAKLAEAPGRVAIYGWHRADGTPIQPLYTRHFATWVDYSQCIRLVSQKVLVNGEMKTVAEVLTNSALSDLLSDEGPIANTRYSTDTPVAAPKTGGAPAGPTDGRTKLATPAGAALDPGAVFERTNTFGERIASFTLDPEVKVLVNAPESAFAPGGKVRLIFYTLPNGNTIAQTIGKVMKTGDDWHFNIQHIGAQTRFLRERIKDPAIVVAYLESGPKSWPTWRKTHGDKLIPAIVGRVQSLFRQQTVETVLSGHSGGGAFIFGYLNAVDRIPDSVTRIAFLDSNYAYDAALGYEQKLAAWLKAGGHTLCVLAYDDAKALLNGKAFVSAQGGTWGRSHAMLRDFGKDFSFSSRTNGQLETYAALGGRVQFVLKQNPERKILHTVQVERNGFIHAMVCATPDEGKGYEYMGERAYSQWVADD